MKYRPEVDGLRSIAVLSVIFFHAGFTTFSGGFVGVDVFFVISGYLITTIILSEMEQEKFSLVTFYERRARRILPALFFVMFLSAIAAYFLLSPLHLVDFSQSLVAISLFSSNILFWQETGYWGVENELKPLLHTWSLAVEEQYYVLFPLFLMLMWSFRKRWIVSSFIIIAFLSFCLSEYMSSVRPTANFFLLPMRAWELAVGSIAAFLLMYKKEKLKVLTDLKGLNEACSFLGICLIGYSIVVFDEYTPFPGVYGLVPTIGTALIIIFADEKTQIGRLLSLKLFVGVGLISYSTYLWHQPLFAFAKHASLIHPSKEVFFILSILSLLLATISWKYIESPFRDKAKFNRQKIFQLSAAGSAIFVVVGIFVVLHNGIPDRFSADFKLFNERHENNLSYRYESPLEKAEFETNSGTLSALSIGNNAIETPTFVVWGDSHAASMLPAIHKSAVKNNVKGIFIERGGCIPLIGAAQTLPKYYSSCLKRNDIAIDFISSQSSIDKVFLISRWSIYAMGERFEREYGRTVLIRDEYTHKLSIDENKKVFERSALRTITKLNELGLEIIIVNQVPEIEFNVPDATSKILMHDLEASLEPSVESYTKRNLFVNNVFRNLSSQFSISFIKPHKEMCDNEKCSIYSSDFVPVYKDSNHLMPFYAESISFLFDDYLSKGVSAN